MTLSNSPLLPDELERFDAFVRSPAMEFHAMDVATLNGLSAALAIGPRTISPAIWLPWVWDQHQGRRAPAFDSLDQASALMSLVMRQYNAVVADFDPLRDANFPWLAKQGMPIDAVGFCQGFMVGVNLCFEDWVPLAAAHPEWLHALKMLGQSDPMRLAEMGDAALMKLVVAVAPDLVRIREHWRAQGEAQPPLRAQAVWDEVRDRLVHFSKPFPHEAVALAHARRQQVAPQLVRVLEAVGRDPAEAMDGNYMLHLFATALLACWRDTSAYRPLLALARLDAETIDSLFGDAIHEMYGRAVASVCDGDLQPLMDLVEDRSVGIWVRMALLDAWKVRVLEGDAPLAAFEQFLFDFGQRCAERLRRGEVEIDGAEMIDEVASQACDVGSALLLEPVRQWYAEGLLDPQSMDQPFFEREMRVAWGERLALARQRRQSYVEDVADEIAWWACYTEDDRLKPPPVQLPILRTSPKIGRNDPCPCGSGRKYKKCHGAT